MFLIIELLIAAVAIAVWIVAGLLPALAVAVVGAIVALRLGRKSRA